jgi:hypothetical protein
MASLANPADHLGMDINTATQTVHSPAFVAQTWIAFGSSFGASLMGIFYLDVDPWPRAFLAMGQAMTVSSSFTLAKSIRDVHEANQFVKRVDNARVEKMLSDREPPPPPESLV